jgi:hygromycin-B 4-O-kinase
MARAITVACHVMQPDHTGSVALGRLSPDSVAAFLTTRLGDHVDAHSVRRSGHGEWSKAFYFRGANGRELVVRFSARDEDFLKDQRAMRFASQHLPIPRLLDIGPAFDGYYAISERARGRFLEHRNQAAMERLLPSLFAMLDACRGVDLSATSGFGVWRGDATAPHASWRDALLSLADDVPTNRTYGWRTRLRQSEDGQRAFDAGYRRLEALVDACPNRRYLVHSDLLAFNVLVRDDRISAVLDWGSSLYGDFLWDLAWFTFWQPWYRSWSAVDLRQAARQHYAAIGLDVPNFEERMRCYEFAIGLDGLAYQAFAGHWDDLAWTARRVLGLF